MRLLSVIAILLAGRVHAKTVDLSHRHIQKEHFFLQIQKGIDLKEVTDLILQDNEFDSFIDCSTSLDNLRTLDLSYNHLQRFFFLCKDEYNLQVLNVSHNKLEYIDDNAFNEKIPKLKILDLSYNRLAIVNETMLEHFKVLQFLSLANNPIGDGIHEGAFVNLQALKHLDLRNVSAPSFSAAIFRTLTNLTVLDLSANPISSIPALPISLEELDVSGTELTHLNGLYLPHLRELDMNHMPNLTALALNDFENLTSLARLSLVGCRRLVHLRILPTHSGLLLPRLRAVMATDCAIETLGPDLLPVIRRLSEFDLRNNPLACDCRMQWLHALNMSLQPGWEVSCSAPEQHKGKLLGVIPSSELECDSLNTTIYTLLWSSIGALVFVLLLLGAIFLTRTRLGSWVIRQRSRDTVAYTNVVESSNDLVRILAVGENGLDRNDE